MHVHLILANVTKENGTCMYCRYELQVVDIVSAGVTDMVTHQREAMSGT